MPIGAGLTAFGRWLIGAPPPLNGNAFQPANIPPALEAGSVRRRGAVYVPAARHINAAMQAAGPTIVARTRWLVRNNGYARAALRSWSSATVGAGIKPSSLVADRTIREAIHRAWNDWTDEADAEGVTDFYGIARRVSREAYLAGECFVRLRPRFARDGLMVPLQLQMLPSEQLPLWKQEIAPNGNPIRLGIEFDRNIRDRRVAYWFYRVNPTDQTVSFPDALQTERLVRVPAEDVIHLFDPVEAGQVRGLSGYSAATFKLFQMDAYDDAELERKKQIARHVAYVEVPEPDINDIDTGTGQPISPNPMVPRPGADLSESGPGIIMTLAPGEKVQISEPGEVGGSYEPFQYRILLQICAALGVPYGELSADLTKATYASSRAGLLAFRQEVEAFQHAVLVYQFLRRVWANWMDAGVLAGALPITAQAYNADRRAWRAMKAITPRAPWVDPVKDIQAEALAVRAGFKARADVIEAMGYDPEETDRRIYEDKQREAEFGLSFDYSWGAHSSAQPPPAQGPATDGGEPSEAAPVQARGRL